MPRIRRREPQDAHRAETMIPARERRRFLVESVFVRIVATLGIVAVSVVIGAVLQSSDVQGWIIGLACGGASVILAAILWSSSQL
jgi:protein-S-isoprenylcysteine O-methyltransferase Ste14